MRIKQQVVNLVLHCLKVWLVVIPNEKSKRTIRISREPGPFQKVGSLNRDTHTNTGSGVTVAPTLIQGWGLRASHTKRDGGVTLEPTDR